MTSENLKNEFENSLEPAVDDLFISLRPLLVFGRLIGIIPFEGIYQKQQDLIKYRKKGYAAVKSIIACILVLLGLIISIISQINSRTQKTTDLAWSIAMPLFYMHGFFLYCYFYTHSEQLIKIFADWTKLSVHYTRVDTALFRHANLIVIGMLVSAILENACLHLDYFDIYKMDNSRGISLLEKYYHSSHPAWEKILPYHECWAILGFVLNKLILYTWNFVDLLITVMSRAIYFKFKALNEEGERILLHGSSSQNIEAWRMLAKDHMRISNFLSQLENFTSPLVFCSYTVNTFYICIQMNLGLTPKESTNFVKSIYAVWSFVHLTARVFILSLSAARINEQAHKISHLLRKCPFENYCVEVERLERRLIGKQIGLTGLGCFVITKSFILKILSTVFTFEIVLLQATNPMSTGIAECIVAPDVHFQSLNGTS